MKTVRIAAAATPAFRGDIPAALRCLADLTRRAEASAASLLVLPEAFLQGYLTEENDARRVAMDLRSPEFQAILESLPPTGPVTVFGLIEAEYGNLFNTAVVVHRRELLGLYRKANLLPGEGAFSPGTETPLFEVAGLRFGINICNDLNFSVAARKLADAGASLLACPANNMLKRQTARKYRDIHNAVRATRCRETGLWLVSADVIGEHGDSISWGPTAVINPSGEVVAQLPLEKTGLLVFDIPVRH